MTHDEEMICALSRWEGEGGAQIPAHAHAYETWNMDYTERRFLEFLGAAVASEWDTLSAAVQRSIFQRVATDNTGAGAEIEMQFARLLQNHNGTTRRAPHRFITREERLPVDS